MTPKDAIQDHSGWLSTLWQMFWQWLCRRFRFLLGEGRDPDTAMRRELKRTLWGNAIEVMPPRRKIRPLRRCLKEGRLVLKTPPEKSQEKISGELS